MLSLLPLLAKARPEDLYLPARLLRLIKKPWRPEQTLALLARFEDFYQQKPAAGRTEKVSRNQPCPCGSGKKYKKCCGAN